MHWTIVPPSLLAIAVLAVALIIAIGKKRRAAQRLIELRSKTHFIRPTRSK